SRRRHTRWPRDWSSDVCSSDLGELGREDAIEARTRGGVAHRDGHLDAAAQVARSPVGGPDVILGGAPVLEVIDARMLQEPAEDEIGRASCRERGWSSGGAVAGK